MYVNPLPRNGFWMCLVYLILGCFIVGACDSCTRWLTLSAPYEIICCRIKEQICCFIMVSSNQNALLCRSCQAPPVPTSSTKTCGSLATNLHCVVKSCQICLLTTQMLSEKKSPFTVESKGLANEISHWEGGWRMVKLKSHDKKQGEARCEGEHGGKGMRREVGWVKRREFGGVSWVKCVGTQDCTVSYNLQSRAVRLIPGPAHWGARAKPCVSHSQKKLATAGFGDQNRMIASVTSGQCFHGSCLKSKYTIWPLSISLSIWFIHARSDDLGSSIHWSFICIRLPGWDWSRNEMNISQPCSAAVSI